MRFGHLWTDDDTTYYEVTFSLEELQAAAAATGLDVQAFRGMHVFHHDDGEHRLDDDREDPKAVAYIEPLVLDALKRRDEAFARRSAWHTAKRQGWQVLDAAGSPVPEPTFDDGRW